LTLAVILSLTAASGPVRAEDTCPLGSTEKTEDGFTWCEPSVCDSRTTCPTGSVCRPVPLCVEIGSIAVRGKGDGGSRLLVRQRCGVNKSCPPNTACSERDRCITTAQADKAGLLTVAEAGTAPAEAPKKACGCSTPGVHRGAGASGALALLALLLVTARRRQR
jgi:MYXO-CTERM domain-containing protein